MFQHTTIAPRLAQSRALLLLAVMFASISVSASLPDPTRPMTAAPVAGKADPAATEESLVLQSVLIAGERRLAIINGRRLQVGDTIGRSRVIRIAAGEVQLRRDGQLQTLTVYNRPAGFVRGKP